jgi:farnesyl-diphosphate farnesyltransferase
MAASPAEAENLAYQEKILQGVSRTFALTIPQLPGRLCTVVGNAYLLCRIADTIEDCEALTIDQKLRFSEEFVAIVADDARAEPFAEALAPLLKESMSEAEQDLIRNTDRVVALTHSFTVEEQRAMVRCLRIMADGMEDFQEGHFTAGLRDMAHLDAYCYHVAGVVGEMLTELFCAHSPKVAARKGELAALSVSFGLGLQMTNILKDIWDDKARDACWLPRKEFAEAGYELDGLSPDNQDAAYEAGLETVLAQAHGHLRNALDYTLLIPKSERGMRNFCLWALGMAVLTLRKVNQNRRFTSGNDVKISRKSVRATIVTTRLFGWSNTALRLAFNAAASGLPKPPRT